MAGSVGVAMYDGSWFTFWTTFVATLPAIIAAVAAFITAMRNAGKTIEIKDKLEVVEGKVDDQHRATNSRLDELIESTAKAARSEGFSEGEQAHRERHKNGG